VGGWVGEWGQKVLSRPSADSFAVGRRQKGDFKHQHRTKTSFRLAPWGRKQKKKLISILDNAGPLSLSLSLFFFLSFSLSLSLHAWACNYAGD
jgi:hypothetical protein